MKVVALFQRVRFYQNLGIFQVKFTHWMWHHTKNLMRIDNCHVNFKNLIGFALAHWESAKPAPKFEDSAILIFFICQNFHNLLVPNPHWVRAVTSAYHLGTKCQSSTRPLQKSNQATLFGWVFLVSFSTVLLWASISQVRGRLWVGVPPLKEAVHFPEHLC